MHENTWGRRFSDGSQADIEKAFETYGPGSRGVVYVEWQNGYGAQVFTVENVGGKVRFTEFVTPPG